MNEMERNEWNEIMKSKNETNWNEIHENEKWNEWNENKMKYEMK